MLEGLNERQSQAALAVEGPVIVFAGAGSGKTRTLTYRIINMICNCHVNPYNILAITFTNKATNVMKQRLSNYLDVEVSAVTISTFHSLCAMILRREIEVLGYSRDFNIVDEEEQLKVINEVLKDKGMPKKQDRYYQRIINYSKCFMDRSLISSELDLDIFDSYNKKMAELNMLDFEDLLLKVYELFSTKEEVLFKYQNKYKYILVDEFQDTNLVQYKIIKLLASKNRNLFIVGDDDQSIYSFRGTNYENISLFKRDFSEYQSFTLNENYRSTQTILDVCNRLIANNKDREKKEMVTSISGQVDDVIVYSARSENDEVNYVIDKISSLKTSLTNYTDFAILYRNSVLLRNVEMALIRKQIPYKVYGGISYLRRKEVKDIVAYFKLMLNHNDILSFKRIVNTPTRGIGLQTIEKIDEIRKINRLDCFTAIDQSEKIIGSSKFNLLNSFKDMILRYEERIETDDLIDIFNDLVDEIEYTKYLKDDYDEHESEERIANLNEFKSILYTIETREKDRDKSEKLRELFDEAVLADDKVQSQSENKLGVTVSTIHSVKGLEFNYVFLIGLEEEIFPNFNRVNNEAELEEERRIAYVAMTRAQNRLFLSFAKKRLLYGRFFENGPSRFLLEAMGIKNFNDYEDAKIITDINLLDIKKRKIDDSKFHVVKENQTTTQTEGTYNISDVVIHTKFGEGIILGIENGIGNIFFSKEKCTKKILLSHPSITKKQ